MQAGDLLGVERRRWHRRNPAISPSIPVVPFRVGAAHSSPLVALPARAHLFEDPARVMGVRDYQPGDSPRRIHWTATASTGRIGEAVPTGHRP